MSGDTSSSGVTGKSTPIVSVGTASAVESQTAIVFAITLSVASSKTVSVDIVSANDTASAGWDYKALPRTTIKFSPGQTYRTVTVPLLDDKQFEGTETFRMKLSNVVNAELGMATAIGTIFDIEPKVTINSVVVKEGTGPAVFTLGLDPVSDKYVAVTVATANGSAKSGSDYTSSSQRISFAPGESLKTVNVSIISDTASESTEEFFVYLSDPSNAIVDDEPGVATITEQASAGSATLKYHPGHYFTVDPYNDQRVMLDTIKPGVIGMQRRYQWKELEPSYGQYDFSAIESDLFLLASVGMRLIVVIEDKTFKDEKSTPSYLWENNTLPHRGGGWVAKRWAPYVQTRMTALLQAIGYQFDSHPNFEGIAFQESAMGLTEETQLLSNYTPQKYRDALISQLINARTHFPTSQVFWYMNYLEGRQAYIADIANAVAPYKIAMGGPDVLPDNWPLVMHAYPFYDQFKNKMVLFGSMQYDSYAHEHLDTSYTTKYWTMNELFRYARDELHVNYVMWTRKGKPSPADSYDWTNALPVISANIAFNR